MNGQHRPLPRWQPGCQGTAYRKLRLAEGARWDLYLLHYPPATYIPMHVDPLKGRRHLRLNLVVLGRRALHTQALVRLGPLTVFWSDEPHAVTPTGNKPCWLLSAGLSLSHKSASLLGRLL